VITPSNSFVALTNDQTQGSARIYPSYIEAASSAARSTGWATSSNTWDMVLIALSSSSVVNKTIVGVRAAVTVSAKVGTPRVIATGVRAAANVTGRAGTPLIRVTGARALVTVTGRPGTVSIVVTPVNKTIVGVRAAVTVTGRPGTPRVIVTGARAALNVTGTAGTPLVRVTGARGAVTAAATAGTPRVIVTGTRALVAVTGKPGAVSISGSGTNATVVGVRAEVTVRAGDADAFSMTQDETVTMTSGYNLGDGFLIAKGMLFSNVLDRRMIRWENPATDLATFDVVTFTNDGTYTNSIGFGYSPDTDKIYQAFFAHVGGFPLDPNRIYVRVEEIDPDDLSHTTLIHDDWGADGVANPGAPSLALSSTHLFLISHTNATLGPDTEVRKYQLSDGALVAQQTITGINRGHAIAFDPDTELLLLGGTSPSGHGWAGWMDSNDLTDYDTTELASSGCLIADDIVIRGDYFWLQDESSDRVFRVKISDLTFDEIPVTVTGTLDGLWNDTDYILVGVRSSGTTASEVLLLDPVSLTVVSSLPTASGVAKINEVIRDVDTLYVATYESTSKVARFTITSVPGDKGTPWIRVTGVRAAVSVTGKPGVVVATTGGSTTIVGVRALVSVTGRPGTPKVAVAGSRGTVSVAGVAGAPTVKVTGARAAATVTGQPGTPHIRVTGVRALVTVTGRPGAVLAPGNKSVTGTRAAVTVTGTAGTPKVAVTGTRAAATVAASAGTPRVIVTGVRALVIVTGKPGTVSVKSSPTITGVRALVSVTAAAGTPKIAVTGVRAAVSAAGRPGTPRIIVTGTRAEAQAVGRPGTIYTATSKVIVGVRGIVYCRANPGAVGVPSLPTLTRRTGTSGPSAVTILATLDGRSLVSAGSNRTIVGVRRTGGRVRVGASRTDTYTPPVEE
jgi:hypothetical protein